MKTNSMIFRLMLKSPFQIENSEEKIDNFRENCKLPTYKTINFFKNISCLNQETFSITFYIEDF